MTTKEKLIELVRIAGLAHTYELDKNVLKRRNPVAIFCYGSQNYSLDDELSDVDAYLIVEPSFEDIAFKRNCVNVTMPVEDIGTVTIVDFRNYISMLLHQNPNVIETLFTKNVIFLDGFFKNKIYDTLLYPMRYAIAHYDEARFIAAIDGMFANADRKINKVIEKRKFGIGAPAGDDIIGKCVVNMLRCLALKERYCGPHDDNFFLFPTDGIDRALQIKRGDLTDYHTFNDDVYELAANFGIKEVDNITCAARAEDIEKYLNQVSMVWMQYTMIYLVEKYKGAK